ncbi:GrpB family protein [Flavobacterium sp. '19STA2R22 D10 B1']|uniref:GrpB family protein n=1 Tax=Flavobacterium aerium TaxID=3037261 RepID=UPI00278BE199|nr:GrpB family protein [Flavobacterium sp. '19STA2R22 D10 B1']
MIDNTIVVVPYSNDWAPSFQLLKTIYESHLNGLFTSIEHVGSTSVVGLAAKPVLDIDIIIHNQSTLEQCIRTLQKLGYTSVGEMGIPGRFAFRRDSNKTPENGSGTPWPQHHLYVCLEDSISLKNHLSFRNYLRSNPKAVQEYSTLKMGLAQKFPNDIDQYVEGKTAFIISILEKTGIDSNSLQDITLQNKAK